MKRKTFKNVAAIKGEIKQALEFLNKDKLVSTHE